MEVEGVDPNSVAGGEGEAIPPSLSPPPAAVLMEGGDTRQEEEEKSSQDKKDQDPDSDGEVEDKPQIRLRNFAEITEQEEEDDDDIAVVIPEADADIIVISDDEVTLSGDDDISIISEGSGGGMKKPIRTYQRRGGKQDGSKLKKKRRTGTGAGNRLSQIATYDDRLLTDLEMTVEKEDTHKPTDKMLSGAVLKLEKWLKLQKEVVNPPRVISQYRQQQQQQRSGVPPPPPPQLINQVPPVARRMAPPQPRHQFSGNRPPFTPILPGPPPPLPPNIFVPPPPPVQMSSRSPPGGQSPQFAPGYVTIINGVPTWQPLPPGNPSGFGGGPRINLVRGTAPPRMPAPGVGGQHYIRPTQGYPTPPPPPHPRVQIRTASQLHQQRHLIQVPNRMPAPAPPPPRLPAPPTPPPSPSPSKNVTAGNQEPIPGTVPEEPDKDLQNKVFPSLVVHVPRCLSVKPRTEIQKKARFDLDNAVKGVLSQTPAKFTEWLMQRGLLKLDHKCPSHPLISSGGSSYQLGIYSDASKQPFSGGYIWKAKCCPGDDRILSVFQGSIFEGCQYPPGTVLKLIYHWSCQTASANVLSWVKVSSLFLKNFYTIMRAVCTTWIHESNPMMGGDGKFVEVGIITLGSSADANRGAKNVSIEILGVFDPITKIIRMKVVNGMLAQVLKSSKGKEAMGVVMEQGARAFQILWPLTCWVDKRSVLLVDTAIDRSILNAVGFKKVHPCSEGPNSGVLNNSNVKNYLRNVVPKLFSSTLSILNKPIIQQFLDELSWREIYAPTPLACYDNLLQQLVTMTKVNFPGGEPLMTRLNRITNNPFVDWSWSYTNQMRRCPTNSLPAGLRAEPGIRECVELVMRHSKGSLPPPPPPPVYTPSVFSSTTSAQKPPKVKKVPSATAATSKKRKARAEEEAVLNSSTASAKITYYKQAYQSGSTDKPYCLQTYYYGSLEDQQAYQDGTAYQVPFPDNLKCPLCTRVLTCAAEVLRHLQTHIGIYGTVSSEGSLCRLCLKSVPSQLGMTMISHVEQCHKLVGSLYACLICEERFKCEQDLMVHMWDLHQRREAPYQCGICGYASSFRYRTLEHFMTQHGGQGEVMCPICLQVLPCSTSGDLRNLITHLQGHHNNQHGRYIKKCPRCVLSFLSDVDLHVHLRRHLGRDDGGGGGSGGFGVEDPSNRKWVQYCPPACQAPVMMSLPPESRTPLMIGRIPEVADLARKKNKGPGPASKKIRREELEGNDKPKYLNAEIAVAIDTSEKVVGSSYRVTVPVNARGACWECGEDIGKPNHFAGRLFCTRCRYSTSCKSSMERHSEECHPIPGAKLVKPGRNRREVGEMEEAMRCKCGYTSNHPNKLARHLVSCEKKTVYPTAGKSLVGGVPSPPEEEPVIVSPEVVMEMEEEEKGVEESTAEGGNEDSSVLGAHFLLALSESGSPTPQAPEVQNPEEDSSVAAAVTDGDGGTSN